MPLSIRTKHTRSQRLGGRAYSAFSMRLVFDPKWRSCGPRSGRETPLKDKVRLAEFVPPRARAQAQAGLAQTRASITECASPSADLRHARTPSARKAAVGSRRG